MAKSSHKVVKLAPVNETRKYHDVRLYKFHGCVLLIPIMVTTVTKSDNDASELEILGHFGTIRKTF